ncbi:MAG: hypothetical protein C3F07_07050 [Anaerolineales bacterium]|nr:MAG: hypothetical protein C3F07_07050 [Anaerolineales bacterium]
MYIIGWLAILLIVYGWQIVRMGGVIASEVDIFVDLVCIFPILLLLWMAFFSQFVLPVQTFGDRQKIFNRLIAYLFGSHGPALFIENGEIKEHSGERLKKGPGVLWLDSASAAVTRTAVAIKQTIGPGVHFIEKGEFIAGTVDLHTQFQSLGPREEDKPFAEKLEDQSNEEYQQIQDRRRMVSALTRDGIEVIPNISVVFRVDTGFPTKEIEPGSRFGYRAGVTRKAKENEKLDQEAIRKAIIGQGVNLNALPDENRRRLAWNELPGALAIDVWREYVGKFTLDELFSQTQTIPPPPEKLPQPTEEEVDPLSQPLQVSPTRNTWRDGLATMLRELNLMMWWAIKKLEGRKENKPQKPIPPEPPVPDNNKKDESKKVTALKVVNEMVKARLTQFDVDILDDNGKRGEGKIESDEYKLLQERGLKVLNVSIGSLRLSPTVDEQLIKQWSATWFNNARAESEQIDRKRNILETSAREQALIRYAEVVSREINDLAKKGKPDPKGTLKTLLMRSRALIRSGEHSEQLRRRMSTELEEIEDMIKWMEANGK